MTSFLVVAAWGYFLYVGVIDPKGGVNILWPLFGMSNQMLAGIALSFACVVIAKNGKKKFLFITAIPLAFILITTSSAAIEKVFSPDIKIGFLAAASELQIQINSGILSEEKIHLAKKMIFNQKLISILALSFMAILWVVVIETVRKLASKK